MTPSPPFRGVGMSWPWFFSELPRFFLGIGSGWSVFQVASVVGWLFRVPMRDPPHVFSLWWVALGWAVGFYVSIEGRGSPCRGDVIHSRKDII